jgi:hypothetical protein
MTCLAWLSGYYSCRRLPVHLCFPPPAYCFLTYSSSLCLLVEVHALIRHSQLGFEAYNYSGCGKAHGAVRQTFCYLGTSRWVCSFLNCVWPVFWSPVLIVLFFSLLTSGWSHWFVFLFLPSPIHQADCQFFILLFSNVSSTYFVTRP